MLTEATIDRTRMLAGMESAAALGQPTTGDRRKRRREIRQRLAECEKADAAIAELTAYAETLDKQLDDAADEHNRDAAPLQAKLAAATIPEKRVAIRQQLDVLNAALKTRCDDINAKLATVATEIAAERERLYARPVLERALIAQGEPRLLCEWKVAQRTLALAQQRAKASGRDLAEFEREWGYRQETSERYVGDFSWKPVEPSKREKSPADYEPPSGDDYEFLKLEAATA
ncbi:hypothetical protein, partial [Botrimarina sp.]|uniref:hypothetical protein n=1 Tax=Botrimarina sp. TaxID=2795802 RepID=UPI0032EB99D4